MIKVSLLGYGKMGKEIEKILIRQDLPIVAKIDNEDDWNAQREQFLTSDVAIEFSTPNTVVKNLNRCFEAGIPVVCGTTGWQQCQGEVLKDCRNSSNALIYGSNFSIGANLFLKINEITAQLMNKQEQYDVMIEETHHATKKDAPSGTAIATANIIINQLDRKKDWALEDDSDASDINIVAHRFGNETGTHAVRYQSEDDCLILCHKAYNRAIFAQGAVRAAVWLTKNPGIYQFSDIFLNI
ncbi:MAG: 4-hydroxy-tetrahydrodipicolinate reductase [Bacteroidales bacterium]|nr:4-hydroxy-tetrahydrodipicolinate reductase [Bacteroidales bacterium]